MKKQSREVRCKKCHRLKRNWICGETQHIEEENVWKMRKVVIKEEQYKEICKKYFRDLLIKKSKQN